MVITTTPQGYSSEDLRKSIISSKDVIIETPSIKMAFTTATKPIVAITGYGPGIAVGGYEKTNKIAFIAFFPNIENLRTESSRLFSTLIKRIKLPVEGSISLYIKGSHDLFVEISKTIAEWNKKYPSLPTKNISPDLFGSEHFFIDSRNGNITIGERHWIDPYIGYIELCDQKPVLVSCISEIPIITPKADPN